jgi:aldose sugar dehydrogenase
MCLAPCTLRLPIEHAELCSAVPFMKIPRRQIGIDRRRLLAMLAAGGVSIQGRRASAAQPSPPLDVEPVTAAQGLRHPWSLTFLPGGEFLITEKDGGLVRVGPDGSLHSVEGLPGDLDNVRQDPRDNSGLFDVALHPDFARSARLYLSYSAKGEGGTTTRLIAARLDRDRLEDVRVLFDATPRTPDRFHYGGALLVHGDHVYWSVGERHFNERDNPPLPAAQDPADSRGKIWRFTLAGQPAPPTMNPPHRWYASGIRATQGFALRRGTGQIWFTDHGAVGGDELNLLKPGANYGWPVKTSGRYRNADYVPQRTLEGVEYTEPVFTWREQTVAPTGLVFYEGHAFPEWRGSLIVAGLSRGNLIRLTLDGDRIVATESLMRKRPVRLRNVRVSPQGDLYAVTDEPNGRLLRLDRLK